MGLATLRENQLVKWRDRLFKLVGRLPNGHWHMVDVGSGLIDTQPDSELWRAFEMRELIFVCESDREASARDEKLQKVLSHDAVLCEVATDDTEKRKIAGLRWKYVQATKDMTVREIKKAVGALRESIQWPDTAPHANSIWNWRKKTEFVSDPISALVDRDDRKGHHEWYTEEVLDIVRDISCRSPDCCRWNCAKWPSSPR